MIILRQVLISIAAALLIWRIGVVGISSHYAQAIIEGERDAVGKALAWDKRQPEALYRQAVALHNDDPDTAATLLAQANTHDMADARPFFAAARAALTRGNQARADALVEMALRLKPADPRIQRQAGDYWLRRNDVRRAISHYSRTLEITQGAWSKLFPSLLKLAENPHTRPAYEILATSPPAWWDSFFSEVAKSATQIETVRQLYSLRRKSRQAPITLSERKSYVARLMKDELTARAYSVWLNGLTDDQRKRLGPLYDGSFELEPGNWGFDWHIHTPRNALIDRVYTYDSDRSKSLHIGFNHYQGHFRGSLYQKLFLAAGTYQLRGRVQTDSLDTQGGLKWVIRCLLPQPEELGESERFLGANEWRDFGFEFQVPEACKLQEIHLVSVEKHRGGKHQITGDAWFDRLAIHKRPPPVKARPTAARAVK
ncbi:tetratricopeptide repeat protein [Candidatus Thiosymbion oneisti]|uniref:tetratricopeptide repeat protein n=1 Tax=Candidatus Thiosymbion oneisti TaxID=589554 RepID=UPI00105DF5EA|nr:hypothetical protein [Candidatus Thiosymbion oneisti]